MPAAVTVDLTKLMKRFSAKELEAKQVKFAMSVAEDMNAFTPEDTKRMHNSMQAASDFRQGLVIWDADYAAYVRDVSAWAGPLAAALERRALQREKTRLEALTQAQNEELRSLNASLEQKVEARTAELRNAHEKLKQNFLTSIRVFSNLIELREGAVCGHSRRVADLARKLAVRLGMKPTEVQDVMLAGLLHDVGKIGLPDELLSKPVSHMSGDELGQWRKHPTAGQNALMGLENLRQAATYIRAHHERWDGQGFPDRLSGLTIPYGARIIAVANDFDGLQIGTLSPRRLKPEEAVAFIQQNRGKRYCPQVVDAFLEIMGTNEQMTLPGHEIGSNALRPGMVLARDLVGKDGVMLLAADFVLDENLIRQLRELEASEGSRLSVAIRPPQGA